MDAKNTLGEPRCLISRAAILHNISLLRRAVGPLVKICAVVKADAYGHGAELIVDTLCNFTSGDLEAPCVDSLAVADLEEAANLPPLPPVLSQASGELPVIILRPVENAYMGGQRARLEMAAQRGWVLTVGSATAAGDLARIAQARGKRANVQIMVNTGLNRVGIDPAEFPGLLQRIKSLSALRLVGISTHFASADEQGNPLNHRQLQDFLTLTAPAAREETRPQRSAANSAGIFFQRDSHLDVVRPGISIYGIDPTGRPSVDRPLRPVLRWTAPLISIRDIAAGASVGYGQTWTATRATRLGLVPIGYADGYPRALSNRGIMLAAGRPAPVAGRVSMDLCVIDLHEAPHAVVGDEVVVLDSDPLSPASVYRMAELAQTIPYEIFCRIGPRVKRVAVEDFSPAGIAAAR